MGKKILKINSCFNLSQNSILFKIGESKNKKKIKILETAFN